MGWKAAQKLIQNWKILRGDNVMIIRGKDKGDTGIIKRVIRSQNRVIVEGKNLVKKHIKQGQGHEGEIFSVEAPLHVSNVQEALQDWYKILRRWYQSTDIERYWSIRIHSSPSRDLEHKEHAQTIHCWSQEHSNGFDSREDV